MPQPKRFYKCASCGKLIPYLQTRCECGAEKTGRERRFKACPACGSLLGNGRLRCDCGYLFVFRGFLDQQTVPANVKEQLDHAYAQGKHDGIAQARSQVSPPSPDDEIYQAAYRAGELAEKARSRAEWDAFFADAQLKNTISGKPIRTREDFHEWKEAFESAKAERARQAAKRAKREKEERRRRQAESYRVKMPWEREVTYTVETPEGDLMSMGPEELKRYTATHEEGAHSSSLRRSGVHFLADPENGEVLSFSEDNLSAYLKRYGTPQKTEDTDIQKKAASEEISAADFPAP